MTIPVIDMNEMAEFIVDKLKKQGTIATEEYVLKVLELEEIFLRTKGVIQD